MCGMFISHMEMDRFQYTWPSRLAGDTTFFLKYIMVRLQVMDLPFSIASLVYSRVHLTCKQIE